MTLSHDGKIQVWSVQGLQISTSGLRDSVRVVETASVSCDAVDISNTISSVVAPVSQMRFQSRVPNSLSVLLTGKSLCVCVQLTKYSPNSHIQETFPTAFD